MKQVSIIIPTYNEVKNVPLLVEEFFATVDTTRYDVELIFVDDNSPDRTAAAVEGLMDQYPVRVIKRSGKLGLGSAVRAGFDASTRDLLGVMDADLSHDPNILTGMLDDLETHDIAIGSRFEEGSTVEQWNDLWRRFLSYAGVAAAKVITGCKDPLSGFFVMKREVIDNTTLTTTGYKILFEILVKGEYGSFSETPFEFRDRQFSSSKLNWKEYLLFSKQIVVYMWYRLYHVHWRFVLAFAGGIALTLFATVSQSIWLDEGLSIQFARETIMQTIQRSMSTDLHPPLYYMLLHWVGPLFGGSVFAYRLVSLFFYGVTAILLYAYLSRLYTRSFATRAVTLLFLFSPFALFYATEARSFMMVMCIGLIQYLLFDQLLRGDRVKRSSLWYVIVSLIGVYTYYPIIFFMVAQFTYVIAFRRDTFRLFLNPWLLIGLLYSPWILTVIVKRIGQAPGHFLSIPWWQIPAAVIAGFAGGRVPITDINHLHHFWPTMSVALPYAVVSIGFLFRLGQKRKNESTMWLPLVLSLLTVAVCLIISATRFPIFDPRYYSQIFPLWVLVFAAVLWQWKQRGPYALKAASILIIMAHVVSIGLYLWHPLYQREQWKDIVPQLESQIQSGDAVIFIGYDQPPPTFTEYQTTDVSIISAYPDSLVDTSDIHAIEQHLSPTITLANRIWFSQFLEWQKDPNGEIRGLVEESFEKTKTIGVFKVQFDLYERKQ